MPNPEGNEPDPPRPEPGQWWVPPEPPPASSPAPPTWPPPPSGPFGPGSPWTPPPPRRSTGAVILAALLAALLAGFAGVGIARYVANRRADGPTLGGQATSNFPNSTANPAVASIAAKVTPAIVDITTNLAYQGGQAAGTGMVLTPSGEVLTNNHVISGASTINAQIGGTGHTYRAVVVGTDSTNDVAVLQLQNASGLAAVARGDSSAVRIGDQVVAIGNALGRAGPPAVVSGTVRAIDQQITVGDPATGVQEQLSGLLQTDAQLLPGDSGGPLVDRAGRVIGMDTAATITRTFRPTVPEGYAIPINHALDIAAKIEARQPSGTIQIGSPAYLGVEIVAPSQAESLLNGYSAPSSSGAVIARVFSGTPAASAGLTAGDEIVRLDGRAVDSPTTLKTILKGHHPGDRVSARWLDSSGNRHDGTLALGAGPPD